MVGALLIVAGLLVVAAVYAYGAVHHIPVRRVHILLPLWAAILLWIGIVLMLVGVALSG